MKKDLQDPNLITFLPLHLLIVPWHPPHSVLKNPVTTFSLSLTPWTIPLATPQLLSRNVQHRNPTLCNHVLHHQNHIHWERQADHHYTAHQGCECSTMAERFLIWKPMNCNIFCVGIEWSSQCDVLCLKKTWHWYDSIVSIITIPSKHNWI